MKPLMRLAVTVACALALHRPFSGRTGAPSNVACLNLRLCICGAMAARCAFAVGASARSCRKSVARVAVAARAVLIEGRTTNPFQTSDARLSLEGADGSRLSAQVLTAKKTVLVFLPVFGTPFAWERVREVELVAPQLRDAGYAVRYVGVGSAGDALKFAERMRLPEEAVLGDPDAATHRAVGLTMGPLDHARGLLGLPRGLLQTKDGLSSLADRYVPIPPPSPGALLQCGGVMVCEGIHMRLLMRDEGMADRAPLGDLVDACCGTLAEAPPGFVTAERPLLGP